MEKKCRPILVIKNTSGLIWCTGDYDSPKEFMDYVKKRGLDIYYESVHFTGATVTDPL